MAFRIRPAGPADAETLVELIHRLAEYEELTHVAAPEAETLAEHLAPDAEPRCEVLLAEIAEASGIAGDGGGKGEESRGGNGSAGSDGDRGDDRERAVGFALLFPCYSTFRTNWGLWLEDLFVRPGYRRRGIGRALLRRVGQIAVARGCARLDWAVLNWNEDAIGFYTKLGARPLDEWTRMRLEGEALRELGGAPPG